MQYVEAGDEAVGQMVAGLDACSHKFTISPPCIVPTENAQTRQLVMKTSKSYFLLPTFWSVRFFQGSCFYLCSFLGNICKRNNQLIIPF